MALNKQIEADFLEAYKSHDEAKTSLLRLLKSSIKNAEIAKKAVLSDEEIIKLIQREIKQRQEAIINYQKGERNDLVSKENEEIEYLKAYLPQELSQEELEKIVQEAVLKVGAKTPANFGKVMGAVMPKIAGRASGNQVSAVVREHLS